MRCYGFGLQNVRSNLNMFYSFFLKCLLLLPPEFSHNVALSLIRWLYCPHFVTKKIKNAPQHPVKISTLTLPNPVGLAAGLDKDGCCIDAWFGMGFGFVEVGTVTPKPQAGNPKPRLFRLKKYKALINRMGFNNQGVDALIARLKKRRAPGMVGVNIGKNKTTPLDQAVDDYLICLEEVYPYADYVTVNISSPNTPGLRELQGSKYLDHLLESLMAERRHLEQRQNRFVPIFVKIAPDLAKEELEVMLDVFIKHKIDGVIATNTSLSRELVIKDPKAEEAGGLSGAPIYSNSKQIIEWCLNYLEGRLPVIAVGGIDSAEKAQVLLDMGASAIQIYTGFIYQGPGLVRKILAKIKLARQ